MSISIYISVYYYGFTEKALEEYSPSYLTNWGGVGWVGVEGRKWRQTSRFTCFIFYITQKNIHIFNLYRHFTKLNALSNYCFSFMENFGTRVKSHSLVIDNLPFQASKWKEVNFSKIEEQAILSTEKWRKMESGKETLVW